MGRRVTPIIYGKVSVKWQKSIAVDKQLPWSLWLSLQETWSHQTWLAHGQSIGPGATVVRSSYLFVGRRVTPMIYRKVSVKWQKLIAVGHLDQQLPWSLCLGLQASWRHQTWHAHSQRIGQGAGIVRFIVSCRGPARHTNDLQPSKCEMAKVNCCRPLRQAVALVDLTRPAGKLEPPNLACLWPEHWPRCYRCPIIVSFRGPASHTNDLPPSKCEMAKVNCCRPFRPAVALVAVARPAGKLETPNLACAWPAYQPRCCSCPFHGIFSWAGMSHQ